MIDIEELFKRVGKDLEEMGLDVESVKEKVTTDPYISQYPLEMGDAPSEVLDILHPEDVAFFHFYVRIIKAYLNDNDSRFVLDGMAEGFRRYPLFARLPDLVQIKLVEAGTFIRAFNGTDISVNSMINAMALRDIMNLRYNGLLTDKQSKVIMRLQGYDI